MKIEVLKNGGIKSFAQYCQRHRGEIDDSFLYDEDLKDFHPDDENPTYVLLDEKEELVGTASLIIDQYLKRGRKARFRILHSEVEDIECYQGLIQAVLRHTKGLTKVFIFVPMENNKLIEIIEKLNFVVERYSFLYIRELQNIPDFSIPEGYEVRSFKPGIDEEAWCQVRNTAFQHLKGHETPITPEMAAKMASDSDYIEDGMMLLYHKDRAVGVVRGAADEYEGTQIMNIGPLAILPEYQGRGLGRILLRAALHFAREKAYHRTILCVNAENQRAEDLYIKEGFQKVEAVACYYFPLT